MATPTAHADDTVLEKTKSATIFERTQCAPDRPAPPRVTLSLCVSSSRDALQQRPSLTRWLRAPPLFRILASLIAGLFVFMHIWALLAAPADARGLQKILVGMKSPAAGFETGRNGEWLWSLSQRPIEGILGVAEGPAVVLSKHMGMPWVRLRMAIPECMLPGHIAWSFGRGDSGLSEEALQASKSERDALLKVLYTRTKDNRIQPMQGELAAARRDSSLDGVAAAAGGRGPHQIVALPPVQEDAPYGVDRASAASQLIAQALRGASGRSPATPAMTAAAAAAAAAVAAAALGTPASAGLLSAALARGQSGHSAFGMVPREDEEQTSREDVFASDAETPRDRLTDSGTSGRETSSPDRGRVRVSYRRNSTGTPRASHTPVLPPAHSLPSQQLTPAEAETLQWFTNAAAELDDSGGLENQIAAHVRKYPKREPAPLHAIVTKTRAWPAT